MTDQLWGTRVSEGLRISPRFHVWVARELVGNFHMGNLQEEQHFGVKGQR